MMHPDDDVARNIWNEMQRDAAAGAAEEEREQRQRRLSMGMCPMCGERHANPGLPDNACSECIKELDLVCSRGECLGEKAGYYYQTPFCEAHLIEMLTSDYEEYLELGSKLNDLQQELEDKCADKGIDPEMLGKSHGPDEDKYSDLVNLKYRIMSMKMSVNQRKARIEDAAENLEAIFPEEYDATI